MVSKKDEQRIVGNLGKGVWDCGTRKQKGGIRRDVPAGQEGLVLRKEEKERTGLKKKSESEFPAENVERD